MKDIINIEIDGDPFSLNPLINNEYNGKVISQFLYYKLDNNNCIIQTNDNIHYKVFLKDILLNKGITSNHFFNTIMFHLNNKTSPFRNELSIIKRVGYKYLINVLDSKSFEIELFFPFKYFKFILRSDYLVASNKTGPILNKDYTINRKMGDNIVITNNNCNIPYKQLRFIINDDHKKSIMLYEKGIIDMTCHSHSSYDVLMKKSELVKEDGSLLYYLKTNNINLANLIFNRRLKLKKDIKSELTDFIELVDSFLWGENNIKETEHLLPCTNLPEYVNVGYADYFPNNIIINILKKHLEEENIQVKVYKDKNLAEFIKNREKYDIYLAITYPSFDHPMGLILSLAGGLSIQKKKLLIKYLANDKEESIISLFKKLDLHIPLAKSRNIYCKRKNCSNISVTPYGKFSFIGGK